MTWRHMEKVELNVGKMEAPSQKAHEMTKTGRRVKTCF